MNQPTSDHVIKVCRTLSEGVHSWNGVTKSLLNNYLAWLDGESYAYATEYLELTTLKQAIKWLVEEGHLPESVRIKLTLRKPQGTDTYCYNPDEVAAIVEFCRRNPQLYWLGHILIALSCTGLRISELASLRWTAIDLNRRTIHVIDDRYRCRNGQKSETRTTKTGRSRSFPIHSDVADVFKEIPRSTDGKVFHGPLGGKLKADTVRRVLIREMLEKLKDQFPTPQGEIGVEHGRLHSFRYYFCSRCAQTGVPEHIVMSWLGHSSSKMVRHYFHLHDDESQRQMWRMDFLSDAGSAVAPGDVS